MLCLSSYMPCNIDLLLVFFTVICSMLKIWLGIVASKLESVQDT